MDDLSSVGERNVKRDFENDRYSAAVLAKAFERLMADSGETSTVPDSVQDAPSTNQQLLPMETSQ